MKALYFDCFSGASGDMILAALLDAGASQDDVLRNLDALDLHGWTLEVSQVQRGPLRSTRAEVSVDEEDPQRTYREIVAILDAAALDASVRARAKSVFAVLARAEGRIHATSPDDVSFHEVGSLDAIIDIVGCCAAFEGLSPARVTCSPIATGMGSVQTLHGVLPLPAPAVTEILQTCGATLVARGERELITPTGAALLGVFVDKFGSMPPITVEGSGYGAGAADTEIPNVLRVLVGELADPGSSADGSSADEPEAKPDESILIETNIDDMAPEFLPHVIDSLLEEGAHDAWVTPIVMKKGRPGITLSVLCDPVKKFHMMEIVFRDTTTLGMRVTSLHRAIADRHWTEVEVAGEKIRVKIGSRHGDVIGAAPEYEDVHAAAKATGLPLKEIYSRALHKAMDRLDSDS